MEKKLAKKPFYNFTLVELVFIMVVLGILFFITNYSIKLIKIRSRDMQRISDLNIVKSSLAQNYKQTKKYPTTDFNGLPGSLGFILNKTPKDPVNSGLYKYYYVSNQKSYILYSRMETKNASAKSDNGKYNNKPLYYETGAGPNWQNLIPKNLK